MRTGMKIVIGILFALGFTGGLFAAAVPADEFLRAGERVVTPHVAWVKPYYQGKVKTLFITYNQGVREMIEIAQRMDLDYDVFSYAMPESLVKEDYNNPIIGSNLPEMKARLKELLNKPYDVIVMGDVNWNILPLDCRYLILQKVKQGAGLLGVVRERDNTLKQVLLKAGAPEGDPAARVRLAELISSVFNPRLPVFAGRTDASTFAKSLELGCFGEGRICLFSWPGGGRSEWGLWQPFTPAVKDPVFEARLTDYDYHLGLLIKLILWTSKHDPALNVRPVRSPVSYGISEAGGGSLEFLVVSGEARKSSALFVVRDRDGVRVFETQRPVDIVQGENRLSFSPARLPAGDYQADLWIRDTAERVIDFASAPLTIGSSCFMEKITFEKTSFCRNEAISGTVLLNSVAPGWRIRIDLVDNLARVTAREILFAPRNGTRVSFQLKSFPITILQHVKVELLSESGAVVHRLKATIPISDLYAPRDDVRLIIWKQLPESCHLILPLLRAFQQAGIDSQYVNFSEWVPMANLWHIPYADRIIDLTTDHYQPAVNIKPSAIRNPCLTDPEYLRKEEQFHTVGTRKLQLFSVSDYSMGDECHFTDSKGDLCFSPTCQAGFRQHAAKEYGTIEKLNREYGTDYRSFDEVRPLNIEEARKANAIACWIDHRLHMDSVWAGAFAFLRETIQRVQPEARVGYEGSDHIPSTWKADDYWKLAHSLDVNSIYFQPFCLAAMRSFLPKTALLGAGWFGGYNECRSIPYMNFFAWQSLLKGANSYWVWYSGIAGGSVTAPDFSFYPFFETGLKEIREIKEGTGKLLMAADRQSDVAILYSPSSLHTSTYFGEPLGPFDALLDSSVQAFVDVGLQPRVVSYAELKDGSFFGYKLPLLYLPYCQSLSDTEIQAIKEFVRNGGILVADVKPGVRNEHGSARPRGGLDEVFGVKTGGDAGLRRGSRKFGPVFYDVSVAIDGGQASESIDGTPSVIWNTYGKGKAVLLNFAFPDYYKRSLPESKSDFEGWNATAGFRTFLQELTAGAGIHPVVGVRPYLPSLEITRFRKDQIEYVGILEGLPRTAIVYSVNNTPLPDPVPATVTFPSAAHVYDVREKTYFGRTRQVTMKIEPCRAKLYALLPYRVDSVEVKPATATVEQGAVLSYRVAIRSAAGRKAGMHNVRVRILGPDGKELRYYSKNLIVEGGSIGDRIPLALNESLGEHRLEIRETVSGLTGVASFKVKEVR